jgi:hypothetical protein
MLLPVRRSSPKKREKKHKKHLRYRLVKLGESQGQAATHERGDQLRQGARGTVSELDTTAFTHTPTHQRPCNADLVSLVPVRFLEGLVNGLLDRKDNHVPLFPVRWKPFWHRVSPFS